MRLVLVLTYKLIILVTDIYLLGRSFGAYAFMALQLFSQRIVKTSQAFYTFFVYILKVKTGLNLATTSIMFASTCISMTDCIGL
jgi:hypothetical protein